jgi:hypothetical protein
MATGEPKGVVEALNARLDQILLEYKTCHGDECRRIDGLKADLLAAIPEKVKAAMDSRNVALEERLKALETSVMAAKPAVNPTPPAPPADPEVEVPEDRVFQCPKCGDALIIGQPECPNETCEQIIDWAGLLNPTYLREVEKQLQMEHA